MYDYAESGRFSSKLAADRGEVRCSHTFGSHFRLNLCYLEENCYLTGRFDFNQWIVFELYSGMSRFRSFDVVHN